MRRRVLFWGLFALLVPASVTAQPPFGMRDSSSAHPTLDSIRVAIGANGTWHGFVVGGAGRAHLDFALLGRPVTDTGKWGVSAFVEGMYGGEVGSSVVARDELGGGVNFLRYFKAGDLATRLVGEAYHFPDAEGDKSGTRVGLAATGIEVPWPLQERNPEVALALYHSQGRLEGLRGTAGLDVGIEFQRLAGWIRGGAEWNDYSVTEPVDSFGWLVGLGVGFGARDRVGIELGVLDPIDTGTRFFGELSYRFWPASES